MMTILCLASYMKGHDFLRTAKRLGCRVLLLTSESLRDEASQGWPPRDGIDEVFYTQDDHKAWNREWVLNQVSWIARTHHIDRIVGLDDFDVETAAYLREHLRIPGIGDTQVRYFRDKLAMRTKARSSGIPVPEFCPVFHYGDLAQFMRTVPAPWLLKPRSMAGSMGIRKLHEERELWPVLDQLGDLQSHYLLEQFVRGDIFHVDTVVHGGEIKFAVASGYGRPPLQVSHEGGIFTTRVLNRDLDITRELHAANGRVLASFGLLNGVSHTEFIGVHATGDVLFLETSARVGGAHIADLVEAATGINLWSEWARVECSSAGYEVTPPRAEYAGLLVSLARQKHPDTSAYTDPEIVWRMDRDNHVGLIARSISELRIQQLLDMWIERVGLDFHASAPPRNKPSA